MAMVSASLGGLEAQADGLRPTVGSHPELCCIHQMNRVNSHSGSAMVTAPLILLWL